MERDRDNDTRHETDARLERMAVPLTVVHANIQLLQRRVRKGAVPDPEALLGVLAKMERATRTMIGELRDAELRASPTAENHGKMTGTDGHVMHDEGA
jgi:hypothetical protein